jgi:hypothetical protein
MTMSFADIPVTDEGVTKARLRTPAASRRAVLRTGVAMVTGAAFSTLEVVNSAVAKAAYFQDWTSTTTGPCAAGNYASNHTENGIKCGPSMVCTGCCWTAANSGSNRTGWHRTGGARPLVFSQRPDQCWSGTYDSWRWQFSDGRTYRCSDGYRYTILTGTVKTICPWAV